MPKTCLSGSDRTYLTQAEAAEYLRLSQRTLERYRLAGTGPAYIRAGRILYSRAALEDWVASRTFRSTSEENVTGPDVARSGA